MDSKKRVGSPFGEEIFTLFAIGVVALILLTIAAALIDAQKAEGYDKLYLTPMQSVFVNTATSSEPPQKRKMTPRQPNRLDYMIEYFSPFSLTWFDLRYYDYWSFDPDPWEWGYDYRRDLYNLEY